MRNYVQLLADEPSWEFSGPWSGYAEARGSREAKEGAESMEEKEGGERIGETLHVGLWFIAQSARWSSACHSPSDICSEGEAPKVERPNECHSPEDEKDRGGEGEIFRGRGTSSQGQVSKDAEPISPLARSRSLAAMKSEPINPPIVEESLRDFHRRFPS
ncbi:hypothetical protein KM043_010881 [Ampulex compressa]|nr:hypothetical protein KM043_010881 [Ampulex compressa]